MKTKVHRSYNFKKQSASSQKLSDGDWLETVLLLTGFPSKKTSCSESFNKKLIPFTFLHFRSIYSIYMLSLGTISKSSIASMAANVLSLLLWYSMVTTEKQFRLLFKGIKNIRKLDISDHFKQNRITNTFILIVLTVPFIFSGSMLYALSKSESDAYAEFWLVGHKVENHATKLILIFVSGLVYFSVYLNSSIFVVAYCTFCNVLSRSIQRSLKRQFTNKALAEELMLFNSVVACCKKLEDCYSYPIALVLLQYSTGIFMALMLFLGFSVNSGSVVLQEVALTLTLCITFFVGSVVYASKIPTAMKDAKQVFKMLYESEITILTSPDKSQERRLQLLKALGDAKAFNLSAGRILRMSKGLIISSLGCFLTYGFLFMQFSTVEVEAE